MRSSRVSVAWWMRLTLSSRRFNCSWYSRTWVSSGDITARSQFSTSRLATSKVRLACTAMVSKNFCVRACFSVVTMLEYGVELAVEGLFRDDRSPSRSAVSRSCWAASA